tara:strand:- start:819 stop:1010 length:192 start_codon:yes stop_codon:yes gene_type:complete
MTTHKQIKLTLIKSPHGRLKNHSDCIRGLGLRKTNSSRVLVATPEVMGMVNRIAYLLKVEDVG